MLVSGGSQDIINHVKAIAYVEWLGGYQKKRKNKRKNIYIFIFVKSFYNLSVNDILIFLLVKYCFGINSVIKTIFHKLTRNILYKFK